MSISKLSAVQATREVACPKCRALPGAPCHSKGRRTKAIHTERSRAYLQEIGTEEFKRRHSIPFKDVTPAPKAKDLHSRLRDTEEACNLLKARLETLSEYILSRSPDAVSLAIHTEAFLERTAKLTDPYLKP